MNADPTLRSSTAWSTLASALLSMVRLASGVWMAHALTTAGNGAAILLLWMAASAYLICCLGLTTSLQRALAEGFGQGDGEEAALALAGRIGRRLGAALVLGAVPLALVLRADPGSAPGTWWVPSAILLVLGLESLGSAALTGRKRFARLARYAVASALIQLPAVAIGCHSAGAAGAALGFASGSLPLAGLGLGLILRRDAGDAVLRPLPPLLRFALHAWLTGLLAAFIWTRMELYLIRWYADDHQLALYGIGLSWAALASQAPLLLLGALTAHFAALLGRGERAAAFRTYRQATILLTMVLAPACLWAAALTPLLLPLIYGRAYVEAVPVATVLACGGIWLGASVGSNLLYGLGQGRILLITGVLGAALAIASGFAVVPSGGIIAAAWARCALQGLMVGIGGWCLQRLIGCPVPVLAVAKVTLAALPGAGLVAAAVHTLGAWGALAVLPAAASYLAMLRGLRVLDPADRELLRSLAADLTGWARSGALAAVRMLGPPGAPR